MGAEGAMAAAMTRAHEAMVEGMLRVGEALVPLEGLRLPALDGTLGEKEQQLLAETLVWALAYGVYTQIMSRVSFMVLRNRTWFKNAGARTGIFCENAQDDIALLLLNGAHHLFGGAMMMAGSARGDMVLWKRGCMVEVGFELWDLVALIIGAYPHTHFIKAEMKFGLALHHLPGLMISALLIVNDLHKNPHLQRLGAWLLLAGGLSLTVALLTQSCNFDNRFEMAQAAFYQVCGLAFFVYARFAVFPVEALALIADVQDPASGLSSNIASGVMAGAGSMALFNTIVLLDVTPKTLRYVRRALNSAVKIDDGPVPPTAQERFMFQQKAKTQ